MDFNLVSKNNLGVVTALLLVVILSQGRFFNFLLDTALGRAVLILFILFISYTNKILGVVSVLFIIIMFNNSNFGYMEGATTMGPNIPTPTPKHTPTTMPTTMPTKKPNMKNQEGGTEGYNNLETERTGFNKSSSTIPANKPTNYDGFEAFSGYSQNYTPY